MTFLPASKTTVISHARFDAFDLVQIDMVLTILHKQIKEFTPTWVIKTYEQESSEVV